MASISFPWVMSSRAESGARRRRSEASLPAAKAAAATPLLAEFRAGRGEIRSKGTATRRGGFGSERAGEPRASGRRRRTPLTRLAHTDSSSLELLVIQLGDG